MLPNLPVACQLLNKLGYLLVRSNRKPRMSGGGLSSEANETPSVDAKPDDTPATSFRLPIVARSSSRMTDLQHGGMCCQPVIGGRRESLIRHELSARRSDHMKRALITGISGQDGTYLAKHLVDLGYEVWGTSRDAQVSPFQNLRRLGVYEHVRLESLAVNDFRSVLQVLAKVRPAEIYNLGGQTSVSLSFQQPVET